MDIASLIDTHLKGLAFEENFSFARHTTIGCGGTASLCAYPKSEGELAALLKLLGAYKIPHCFLGAGANVLPAEGFFEGVVVKFTRFSGLKTAGTEILCGAGVTAGALLRFARAKNIGGFEFLTGIPASLGGAAVMNAGVKERHIADVVQSIYAVEGGRARIFPLKACGYAEKQSIFRGGIAVFGMRLRGYPSSQEEIAKRSRYFCAKRAHLPKGRSMGCVFVNPAGASAGEIIDRCGLKGLSVGGAFLSTEHANFILNGGASAEEISALIALVKKKVFDATGICLREEICRIP